MVRRKIIAIDENLCDGCGLCVPGCAEGALRIVAGKAMIVREDYCDGFGDCIAACPTGALTIVEREAVEYDSIATRTHVAKLRGDEGLAGFEATAARHDRIQAPMQPLPVGGCPGSMLRVLPTAGGGVSPSSPNPSPVKGAPAVAGPPTPFQLGQWPVMLHLVPPQAPFFKNRELCVLSTCAPVALPTVQERFLRGRGIVVACPKLDRSEGYLQKLAAILAEPTLPRAVVVRMEVPCCSGLTRLTVEAARLSGRTDLRVSEAIVGVAGSCLEETTVFDAAAET